MKLYALRSGFGGYYDFEHSGIQERWDPESLFSEKNLWKHKSYVEGLATLINEQVDRAQLSGDLAEQARATVITFNLVEEKE